MLAILMASDAAHAPRTWPAQLGSAAVHVALIATAVVGTQAQRSSAGPAVRDTIIYLPVDPSSPRPTLAGLPPVPALPGLRLPAVLDLPSSIVVPQAAPPGSVGLPWTEPWPGMPGVPRDTGTGMPGVGGLPVDARVVEQPPTLLAHPAPRYPELLRQAGIEGTVLVEVVLDTLGRVEPGSMRVVRGAHALFEAEALAVVRGSHYRPGRMGERAVRVRIQVPIGFALRR